MRLNGLLLLLVLPLLAFGEIKPQVIYGEDDRLDVYAVQDAQLRDLSRSTVALISSNNLEQNDEGFFDLNAKVFGPSRNYCKDERFYDQPAGAFCSGFLVGPDLIATAGHCVESQDDCENTFFVFDFKMEDERVAAKQFSRDQVYGCKQMIASQAESYGADFAFVRLDRPVVDRTPLKLRSTGALQKGDEVTLVGHPSGLPLKIAGGATVRRWASNKAYFIANTDSYGGNSGSAVINTRTLEVEGILVRGETDFQYDSVNACQRSKICDSDACRGEDVTDIRFIAKLLTQN